MKMNNWCISITILLILSSLSTMILLTHNNNTTTIVIIELIIIIYIVSFCLIKLSIYKNSKHHNMVISCYFIMFSATIRFLFCISTIFESLFQCSNILYYLLKASLFIPVIVLFLVMTENSEKLQERANLILFNVILSINTYFITFLA
jgi:hypothetical protein